MAVICHISWHDVYDTDYETLISVYKRVIAMTRAENVGNIRVALSGTRDETAKWLKTES